MLNFKELQAFQGGLQQQQRSLRSERGEQSYQEGLHLLERYHQQPGQDILLQAMHKFIACMSQQRGRVEPLVILAYIYYSLKSPQLAAKYYRLAAAIDPGAEPVRRLQEILTSQAAVPTIAEVRQGQVYDAPPEAFSLVDLSPVDEADFDALYDEVEALTQRELERLVAEPVSMAPALDPDSLARLARQQSELAGLLASLKRQLEILDQDIDVQPLQARLHPFEVRLRQFQRLQDASQQAGVILQGLEALLAATEAELARDPLSDQALDALLDHCDLLADQIDGLDKQGVEIQALEARYNHLVTKLTQYQDLLEEL